MESTETTAVSLEAVSYSYDTRREALRAASLRIARGRRVVVCGANGSGKSTALALVAGTRLAPFAADDAIRVLGLDPRRTNLRADGRVAFLGGGFRSGLEALPPRARNVAFRDLLTSHFPDFYDDTQQVSSSEATLRARRLVELLAVDGDWRPATASAGQTTRMQLVLQLAPPAELYLVDELTRDLDLVARDAVLAFLRHDTVLYATHVFHGLERWATDLLHLRRGAVEHHVRPPPRLYDTVLDWLLHDEQPVHDDDDTHDDDASASTLPPPSSSLPSGWQSRDNTVEASYGSHAFSARQAHGIFADRHATVARQKFEALYLTRR